MVRTAIAIFGRNLGRVPKKKEKRGQVTFSVLLRYLEEALAEGISKLRAHGFAQAFEALRFPIQAGYMTVSQIIAEGSAIGTITLGGLLFHVYISLGPIPHHD